MLPTICSIPECAKPRRKRGWCGAHYFRWAKHGDPLGGGVSRYANPKEALAQRTEWQGECLVWTGARSPHGYGQLNMSRKHVPAHRFSYEIKYGPIPEGLVIDHMCHNPPCVNPDHLQAVTISQNAQNRAGAQENTTSGVRGVSWHSRDKRWVAEVVSEGKKYRVGSFANLNEAAAAVLAKRLEVQTNNLRDRIL